MVRPELLNKQSTTIGAQNCAYHLIKMGENHWQWVRICQRSGGGVGGQLSGCADCLKKNKCTLLGFVKNSNPNKHGGQFENGLNLFIRSDRRNSRLLGASDFFIEENISSAQSEVNYYTNYVKQFPNSAFGRERLAYWKQQLQYWIMRRGLTYQENIEIGTGKGSQAHFNEWNAGLQNTYNKTVNFLQNQGFDSSSFNLAGIPVWGWVLLAGGGAWIIYENAKKRKRL